MLFASSVPDGFLYRPDFISAAEEQELLTHIRTLEFQRVEMRGAVARRRTMHYGWTYGYYARRTEPGPPLPDYLAALRARVAEWASSDAAAFVEALVTEYPQGAPIGWHRDAPQFGDIVAGVSLLTSARMKFRPYLPPEGGSHLEGGSHPQSGSHPESGSYLEGGRHSTQVASGFSRKIRRTTHEIPLAARSGYLMTAAARRDYEHSIPPVGALRYSITFRTLRRS